MFTPFSTLENCVQMCNWVDVSGVFYKVQCAPQAMPVKAGVRTDGDCDLTRCPTGCSFVTIRFLGNPPF